MFKRCLILLNSLLCSLCFENLATLAFMDDRVMIGALWKCTTSITTIVVTLIQQILGANT